MFPGDNDPDEGRGAAGNDDDGPREPLDAGLARVPGHRGVCWLWPALTATGR